MCLYAGKTVKTGMLSRLHGQQGQGVQRHACRSAAGQSNVAGNAIIWQAMVRAMRLCPSALGCRRSVLPLLKQWTNESLSG